MDQCLAWTKYGRDKVNPLEHGLERVTPTRRISLALCMVVFAGACVNLSKPQKVAECAAQHTCDQIPIVDAPTTEDAATPNASEASVFDVSADAATDRADEEAGVDRDAAEGACAFAGVLKPAGTVCREAAGPCDVAESCDGVNADCPADKLAAAGKECRPSAGDCDIAETCSGTSMVCPVDGFKQAGTICRAAAGLCDVPESCTGSTAACPIDTMAPAVTVCRASTDDGKCDPEETCTGSDVRCPADLLYAPLVVPRGISALPGTLQATVSWNMVPGASGYNVKRSTTSGTGYTTLVSSPTTSTIPFIDVGLTGSTTYYYVVSSINTIATCESADSYEVAVTPVGQCTPTSPPVITAKSSNGAVTLSWAAVTGAVSYSVARSLTTGTGYAVAGAVTTQTTFTDNNVLNGTIYFYVVTASNGTCSSANSNEASASPACTPPAAPTGLTTTAGNGSVTLNWTVSTGATSYSIYRNSDGTASYVLVNSTSQPTFTDSNVVNGTKYYYVVSASNGSCSSGNSAQVPITPACVPPSAPTGVTPTAGDGQISLAWTASPGATLYRVSRNTTGTGTFTQIATPAATSYLNSTLVNGTTYYYVVAASNGSCWSADSLVASATPVCTPPSVPGTLSATAGDSKITLSWVASTPAPPSYTLQRKTGPGGTYETIASPTVASYTDTNLTNGTTYTYRVSASNGSCSSTYSAEAFATPVAICTQTAPGIPLATVSGSMQVTITWTASAPTPTSYSIGRSTTSGSGYVSIGSVAGTILTYTDADTGLVKSTTYYYEVTAVGSVCTATSTETSATASCSAPAAPSAGLGATNSNGTITVSWTAVSGATAYTVYRSVGTDGIYTEIKSSQTSATFTDPASGLTNGTNYFYKISASNANAQCVSDLSTTVSTRSCIIPTAPTGVSMIRAGNNRVKVMWTNSPGAVLYNVQRSTSSGSGYASVGTSSASPYMDTTVSNGSAFYYVVTAASDAAGNCSSANSAEVNAVKCTVLSGNPSEITHFNTTDAICVVTCDDISWWDMWNWGSRQLFVNETDRTGQRNGSLPAKVNDGYAFYFTPGQYDIGMNWGGTAHACP
jgi:fibronectin type 3 domain-containing protein